MVMGLIHSNRTQAGSAMEAARELNRDCVRRSGLKQFPNLQQTRLNVMLPLPTSGSRLTFCGTQLPTGFPLLST